MSQSALSEEKTREVINQGLEFLKAEQLRSGSFLSLSSPDPKKFNNPLKFNSVFSTTLILSCLLNLEKSKIVEHITQKCAHFLISQKSKSWSFNYWSKDSAEFKKLAYPDDLDDTFCALSSLWIFNPKLINGSAIASILNLLTATEVTEGGPYKTWLAPFDADEIWKDVDLAVNANVAYFLSLQEVELPKLTQFIEQEIENNRIKSPYYPTVYPIIYFISRFYKGPFRKKLISQVMKKKANNHWGNPLNTALSLLALMNFQIPLKNFKPSLLYLLKTQKNGSWPEAAFYTGVNPKRDQTYYAGSKALTTAFCLEALNRYQTLNQNKFPITNPDQGEKIYKKILLNVKKRFNQLDENLKIEGLKCLENSLQKDNKKQVALLPYYFQKSLGKHGQTIPRELIINLGIANLYGWIAYTIYDDFLDEEGKINQLPVANFLLRELTLIFNNILPGTGFASFFQNTMTKLDCANTWEVKNCRIKIMNEKLDHKNFKVPNYKNLNQLAEKSLGHALAPLGLLFALGFNEKSEEVKNTLAFFKHYLIARQLNDDAHDFEKDLKTGQVNYVGAVLLKRLRLKQNIEFNILRPKLQKLFWYEVIKDICRDIFKNTAKARFYLCKTKIVSDFTFAEKLVSQFDTAAKTALEERKKTLEFLKKYQKNK